MYELRACCQCLLVFNGLVSDTAATATSECRGQCGRVSDFPVTVLMLMVIIMNMGAL